MGAEKRRMISDGEIVELFWKRDERAISETETKYKHYLLTIAGNILQDPLDCEECLNDTYLDAWNAIPPARPAFLQGFLSAIMRRRATDRYKSNRRKKRIPSELTVSLSELEEILHGGNEMESEMDSQRLRQVISDFVRSLSRRQMYIFMCRYYLARPISEIVARLGCSTATVDKEIAKIKKALREKLKTEGYQF
jgi:RNA polymerase sigma-70 factor (ECF subfamily)